MDHRLGAEGAGKGRPSVHCVDGYRPADSAGVEFDLYLLIPVLGLPQARYLDRSTADTNPNLPWIEAEATPSDGDDVARLAVVR